MQKYLLMFFILFLSACSSTPEITSSEQENTDNIDQWQTLGNAEFTQTDVFSPALAISKDNTIYVAYADNDTAARNKGIVMRYRANSWETVGSSVNIKGVNISIAIDSNNIPYIAYVDPVTDRIIVQKYHNTAWETVGQALGTGGILDVALTIGNDNTIYVAYRGGSSINLIVEEMNQNQSGFTPVGSSVQDGVALCLSLAVYNNNPVISYTDGNLHLFVKVYNGTDWIDLNAADLNAVEVRNLNLESAENGSLYITYQEIFESKSGIFVQQYNTSAGSWDNVGNLETNTRQDVRPSLAIDSNNIPHVIFVDHSENSKTTIMKFLSQQNSWNASENSIGLSSSSGLQNIPIAFDNNNVLYFLYKDPSSGKATVMKTI